jgi:hypothetical protein
MHMVGLHDVGLHDVGLHDVDLYDMGEHYMGVHESGAHAAGFYSVDTCSVGLHFVGIHGMDKPATGTHKTRHFFSSKIILVEAHSRKERVFSPHFVLALDLKFNNCCARTSSKEHLLVDTTFSRC